MAVVAAEIASHGLETLFGRWLGCLEFIKAPPAHTLKLMSLIRVCRPHVDV